MSRADNVPRKDDTLLSFTSNISTKLTATPSAFGVTSTIATQLASLLATFSTKLAAATNPDTRGHATVFAKDTARTTLVTYLRGVIRQIQGTITVTNEQRTSLGITVRRERVPIPVPDKSPHVVVKSVVQNRVTVTLNPIGATTRGKPAGVAGIAVFSYLGSAPPADIEAWKFEGNTTRTEGELVFPTSAEPFSTVWITAFYFNPRGQSGMATTPVSTNLGTWLVQAENGAASPIETMRQAA